MNKTNLSNYYPTLYQDILETDCIVDAENQLFDDVQELTNEVEKNQFILTANLRGLAEYERMQKIQVHMEDTIEVRRKRVMSRWNNQVPYTWNYLTQKLIEICGEGNFNATLIAHQYRVKLCVTIGEYGALEELIYLLGTILPCNMILSITNDLYAPKKNMFIGGCIPGYSQIKVNITNDSIKNINNKFYNGKKVVGYSIITIGANTQDTFDGFN